MLWVGLQLISQEGDANWLITIKKWLHVGHVGVGENFSIIACNVWRRWWHSRYQIWHETSGIFLPVNIVLYMCGFAWAWTALHGRNASPSGCASFTPQNTCHGPRPLLKLPYWVRTGSACSTEPRARGKTRGRRKMPIGEKNTFVYIWLCIYIYECVQRNHFFHSAILCRLRFRRPNGHSEGESYPTLHWIPGVIGGYVSVARQPLMFVFFCLNDWRVRLEGGGELFCIAPIWHVVDAKANVRTVWNYFVDIAQRPHAV